MTLAITYDSWKMVQCFVHPDRRFQYAVTDKEGKIIKNEQGKPVTQSRGFNDTDKEIFSRLSSKINSLADDEKFVSIYNNIAGK